MTFLNLLKKIFGRKKPPEGAVDILERLFLEAVQSRASDIHLQPQDEHVAVRMRFDGVLFDTEIFPRDLHIRVVSRLKIMCAMDISEHRVPQDGHTSVEIEGRKIDLRVSCIPTALGERMVIRLLDKETNLQTLSDAGMNPATLKTFRDLITRNHGLVLVTGPTGSGKTTTLYAALRELHDRTSNIITLEDPIEYQLEGLSQIQISEGKGVSFASGLRSILRQDPDVIMVGEIRDKETATLAIQAAMTGHLVLSTMHTNDAPSTVARLLDLGIEPYLVASAVTGVLAQRLVRRVCEHCAQPDTDLEKTLSQFQEYENEPSFPSQFNLRRGTGCRFCRGSGSSGRLGLFELMVITDDFQTLIQSKVPVNQLKALARKENMLTLREDGLQKICQGQTTSEEVLRATSKSEQIIKNHAA